MSRARLASTDDAGRAPCKEMSIVMGVTITTHRHLVPLAMNTLF